MTWDKTADKILNGDLGDGRMTDAEKVAFDKRWDQLGKEFDKIKGGH